MRGDDVVVEMSEGRRVQPEILSRHKIPTWISPDLQSKGVHLTLTSSEDEAPPKVQAAASGHVDSPERSYVKL